jgi:hypothetical protein
MGLDAGYGIGSLKPGVCTSTTRPSSPFDGQVIYETDTDKVAVYDASAWVYKTGTTAPTSPALVYLTGASFSGVTTVSAATNTFTSTYRNYLILVNFSSIASSGSFRMRLRASGADITNSNYFTMQIGINSNGGSSNTTANNTSSWNLGDMLNAGATNSNATITLFNPQQSTYTAGTITTQGEDTNVGALGRAGGLNFALTTVADSVTFFNTVSANMSGTYRIYGLADS